MGKSMNEKRNYFQFRSEHLQILCKFNLLQNSKSVTLRSSEHNEFFVLHKSHGKGRLPVPEPTVCLFSIVSRRVSADVSVDSPVTH